MPGEPRPGDAAAGATAPDVLRRHRGLVGRTLLVALATFASRIAGFLREVLSAALFGDRSPMFDAFVTAWRVPNLFRRFLGEGALSTALQTALIEVDDRKGEAAGRRLFLGTLRALAWILVGLCAAVMLGVWLLPDAMPVTGMRWLGDHPQVVRELTVQLMPFVVLVCLAAACSGALNVRGHFLLPAAAPVVMNAVWIAALFAIAWEFGREPLADPAAESARQLAMVRWLAASMLVGGLLLFLVQVPALWVKGLLPGSGPAAPAADAGPVWAVLRRSLPLAFGAALYQVNVMIDGFMAVGLLDEGGPTAHHMATRLQQLPMSLTSIAATSAVFPALSALGLRRELGRLRALHDRTQLAVAFVALPATVGLVALSEPIVAVCLGHGEFGASGIARTAAALRFLALAIIPAGAVGLIARCYYALGDFATPVRVSAAMVAANVVLNVLFIVGLGMDVDGLALSTALTSWGNLGLLLPGLGAKLGLPRGEAGRASRAGRMLLASAACGAVGLGLERALEGPGGETSVGALVLAVAASLAVYSLLAHLLRIPEWHEVLGRLSGRASAEEEHATRGKT